MNDIDSNQNSQKFPLRGFLFLIGICVFFYWICDSPKSDNNKDKADSTAVNTSSKYNSNLIDSSQQAFNDAYNKADTNNSYAIKDTVKTGNFVYKIKAIGYDKTLGSDNFEKRADGIYLVFLLYVTNDGAKSQIIDNSEFKLVDKDGNEYNVSYDASAALELSGEKTLYSKECPPHIRKVGYLCFEVPKVDSYFLQVPSKNDLGTTASIFIPNKHF